jgi:hypothetical protein
MTLDGPALPLRQPAIKAELMSQNACRNIEFLAAGPSSAPPDGPTSTEIPEQP